MEKQKIAAAIFERGAMGPAFIALLVFGLPLSAAAGEREAALSLCRAAIAQAFAVSADESGAHFVDSATSARSYTMRFQVRTTEVAPIAATCKVRRDPLAVAAITPAAKPEADTQAAAAPVPTAEPGSR